MATEILPTKVHSFGSEKRDPNSFPLDNTLYSLRPGTVEYEFWQKQTGIQDENKLKEHVLKIQAEAYALYPYGCIRHLLFLIFRIPRIQGYDRLLKLCKERENAILLDVGCCFGTDTRKVAADGWPATNLVATDIQAGFWELGHKLFGSTNETFPAKFIPGDVMDPTHLDVAPVLYAAPGTPVPTFSTLTSLNPLRGHVSAIHTGAFFHLFGEEQQARIAHALGGLLSPEPGSMIVGTHSGAPEKGIRVAARGLNSSTISQFCHSPESWTELWDGQVFRKGSVKVDVKLLKAENVAGYEEYLYLTWSVTRL